MIEKVALGGRQLYRPEIPTNKDAEEIDNGMIQLMKDCWSEDPNERLEFNKIKKMLKEINKGQ